MTSTVPVYVIDNQTINRTYVSSSWQDREMQMLDILNTKVVEVRSIDLYLGETGVVNVLVYYDLHTNNTLCGNFLCDNFPCVDRSGRDNYNAFASHLLKSIIKGGVVGNVVVLFRSSQKECPTYLPRMTMLSDLDACERKPIRVQDVQMDAENQELFQWTNGMTTSQIETCMFAKDGKFQELGADIMQIVFKQSFMCEAMAVKTILNIWNKSSARYYEKCFCCAGPIMTNPCLMAHCIEYCYICSSCMKQKNLPSLDVINSGFKCPCGVSSWTVMESRTCNFNTGPYLLNLVGN